ncbi:sensor histidine kinase [Rhizobium sp. YIM 134829]|uniref:sensor histidine kinase n=1 Tax=Rhizobium sp. YIM 134829 TaxID=3390453 RepID=UPI00397BDBDA
MGARLFQQIRPIAGPRGIMQGTNPVCSQLYRDFTWEASPLGAQAKWPVELRTVINIMLGSLQPMLIVWGPSQITLYNDGYAAMCGDRHPHAFGRPFRDLWFDIWEQVEPIIEAAYAGQGTAMDDIEFLMHRNGYPEETHFAFSYTPVRDPWGTVLGMFCSCNEITAEVMARRAERTQRERFLQVFELSPGGIAMLDGPDHVFDYANAEYYSMIGLGREILGKPVAEAVSEVVRQGFIERLDKVYQTGEPFIAKDLPIELNRGAEGEKQSRLIDLVYQPIRRESGSISGILVQARDVTDQRADEARQAVLSHELGHRLKNQLAMVQAIATQTLRNAPDLPTARKRLNGRIAVLSAAHDTILQGGTGSSTIRQLVNEMITLHDDPSQQRINVSGPNLKVGSRPALSMSLILHELSTNALKYGALSAQDGRIDLTWRIAGERHDRLELIWTESGGPIVSEPKAPGTGMRLITAGLNGTSDCSVEIDYRPLGLQCRIIADLETFQKEH